MIIPVSELIVRYLEKLGITHVFGMPGAHILPVYDALYDSGIQTVLVKHEQGAAFMACGYARATGKIAACIATAGPGATNLVTGIANAYADRLPVLVITGETSTHIFGKGGLQESSGEGGAIDQNALFQGITRYHKMVERTDYLPYVLNQAARILASETPGPVLLSFPFNVQKEPVDAAALDVVGDFSRCVVPEQPYPLAPLVRLLEMAKHPVIIAGYGCLRSGATEEIGLLATRQGIPVATSLKAKGIISEDSPFCLGSLGVTSSNLAYRYIVEEADFILFLGTGFNERTSYLWDKRLLAGKRIAQIDADPAQLEKVFQADWSLCADIKSVLQALLEALGPAPKGRIVPQWPNQSRVARQHIFKSDAFALVEALFERLSTAFPKDLMVFDDNIIFAQNFFHVSSGNAYFPNTGISSLGHAIPAAIGARFALQRPTIAILGDGGFQMCGMELMTAVNYHIPLTVVLFNNASMGLIRKNQYQQYQQRYIDCDFINPDYALLARAFGIRYYRVSGIEDLDTWFGDCDFEQAINLVDVMLDKDAFPEYHSGR